MEEYTHPFETVSSYRDYVEMVKPVQFKEGKILCGKCGRETVDIYEKDTNAVIGIACEKCHWQENY